MAHTREPAQHHSHIRSRLRSNPTPASLGYLLPPASLLARGLMCGGALDNSCTRLCPWFYGLFVQTSLCSGKNQKRPERNGEGRARVGPQHGVRGKLNMKVSVSFLAGAWLALRTQGSGREAGTDAREPALPERPGASWGGCPGGRAKSEG